LFLEVHFISETSNVSKMMSLMVKCLWCHRYQLCCDWTALLIPCVKLNEYFNMWLFRSCF